MPPRFPGAVAFSPPLLRRGGAKRRGGAAGWFSPPLLRRGAAEGGGVVRVVSAYALDDPHIALDRVAEDLQRLLVSRAVVRRDRLLHAVELDHHGALVDPRLVHLRGVAAHEVAPARRLQSGGGDLRVGSERIGVLDRVITDYPIGLGHRSFLSWWVSPAPEGSIITGRGQRPPDPAAGAGPFRTP